MVQWPMVEHFGIVMRWDTWAAVVILAQFVGIPAICGPLLAWVILKELR